MNKKETMHKIQDAQISMDCLQKAEYNGYSARYTQTKQLELQDKLKAKISLLKSMLYNTRGKK
jgi:hypothetical protein